MKHAALAIVLICSAGCGSGSPSPYLAIFQEKINELQELTEVLSTVKDESSMAAARREWKKRSRRFEQQAEKNREVPKPSAAIKRQVEEELAPQFNRTMEQLQAEIRRIKDLPGGDEFLQGISKIR
jgi:hypothetical protein